jgi:hypothetical protein
MDVKERRMEPGCFELPAGHVNGEDDYGKQTWGTLRHFDSSSGHSCSFDRSEPVTEEACHAGHHVLARYTLLLIFA